MLLTLWILQLVYVDDLHMVAAGPQKFKTIWMAVLLYEVLGTPFGYHKFSGGVYGEFVGYRLDYGSKLIGVTESRGRWIVKFLEDLRRNGYVVSMRRFAEFLGRLGFTSRVLLWIKPHLAPLYAWSAAVDRGVAAKAPKLVILVCMYLEQQFGNRHYMFSVNRPRVVVGDSFRTDAKCELNKVVLGGYCCHTGSWFSLVLVRDDAPYLFKEDGSTQWASAPAELLSVLVALHCFGYLSDDAQRSRRCVEVWLQAGTDNLSIDYLMRKSSTTRWPLTLVNMQLSDRLMASGLRLTLRWRPRDENVLADDLTNERFTDFKMEKRVEVKLSDLKLVLLEKLWNERNEFLDREGWKTYTGSSSGEFQKSEWRHS